SPNRLLTPTTPSSGPTPRPSCPLRCRPTLPATGAGYSSPMRRPPGWVPNQHGAWAMLVLPVAVGALRAGPRWDHLHLLVAWLVAYLAFFAAGTWLRSRRRARYRPALVTYAAAAAV